MLKLVIEHPLPGPGEAEGLPRPGNADVHQPPLLLQAPRVIQAAGGRKDVFLGSDDENVVEFEALRAVQRHHRDRVPRLAGPVQIRDQGDVFKVVLQRALLGKLSKGGHRPAEFRDVLHPALGFLGILLRVLPLEPGLVDQIVDVFRQGEAVLHDGQHRHQLREGLQAASGPFVQPLRRILQRAVKRDALLRGVGLERLNRRLPEGPFGNVDNPPKAQIVRGIDDHPQVGEDVLDFLALVELLAPENPIGDPRPHEHFFDHAALGVVPIENGDASDVRSAPAKLLNPPGDPEGLVLLVDGGVGSDFIPVLRLRPEPLVLTDRVVGDHLVRRVENDPRAPVILLQPDDLRIRIILFEIENVANVRPAPSVDALVIVPDDAEVPVPEGNQPDQLVLGPVRILIFVHQHILKPLPVIAQNRRMIQHQLEGFVDQIIKIKGVQGPQLFFIEGHRVVNLAAPPIPGAGPEPFVRRNHPVLGVAYPAPNLPNRQKPVVDVQLLQDLADDGVLILIVIDGEAAGISELFDIPPKDPGAGGVKGADPGLGGGLLPRQLLNPLLHFGRGLVGKGQGQNVPRRDPVVDEVRDPVGQGPGLAAAGPRQNEHRPLERFRGHSLLPVQIG